MSFSIQTFTWLSDDIVGGKRELTPRLHDAKVEWSTENEAPHFQIHLECEDEVVAEAWSFGDRVAIEFTIEDHGGIVEGTAEIANYKTHLSGPADYRICSLRLEPEAANIHTDKFPAALQKVLHEVE